MSNLLLLFSYFLITAASSEGANVARNKIPDPMAIWRDHKTNTRQSLKVDLRQSSNDDCYNQFVRNLPSYCNIDALSGGVSELPEPSLTDEQLDTLNTAYSKFCVPDCLNPYTELYNCQKDISDNQRNFAINAITKGTCGQESGDYCNVRLIRRLKRPSIQYNLYQCNLNSSGIHCNSNSSSDCLNDVALYSSNMGCCTEPMLGAGVHYCNVTVPPACTGVTGTVAPSTAAGVMATPFVAVSLLLLASLVGVLL